MAAPHRLVITSHWSRMIEHLPATPQQFYRDVEGAVGKRQIPDVAFSRVQTKEGGVLSAKREYLEVRRKGLIFHVCGAPFGNGFFVSWWLGEPQGILASLLQRVPLLGRFAGRAKPLTYYQLDTQAMFRTLTHGAVLDVVDEMMNAKGLKVLADDDRKPILKNVFGG